MTTSSSLPSISEILPAIHLWARARVRRQCNRVPYPVSERVGTEGCRAYFFMTCKLTLVMSTFWLNSGGNFVLLRSFASTPVAMVGRPVFLLVLVPYVDSDVFFFFFRREGGRRETVTSGRNLKGPGGSAGCRCLGCRWVEGGSIRELQLTLAVKSH